jgi:putrescine importer
LSNLVNYGALFGFGTLNLAVIWLYYVKKKGRSPLSEGEQPNWKPTGWRNTRYLLLPILGFVSVVYVWLSMDHLALIIGSIWLFLGVVFLAIKTKGFRKFPPHLDL